MWLGHTATVDVIRGAVTADLAIARIGATAVTRHLYAVDIVAIDLLGDAQNPAPLALASAPTSHSTPG